MRPIPNFCLFSPFLFCVVHGNWSEWADWGACSQSCGTGVQGRRRTCTNPTPRYGGRDCVGVATEIQNCNLRGCPGNDFSIFVCL